jgi:biopolymer transport protein ExbD
MKRAVPFRQPELLSEMNVTPFIDVMLVLLIMMILTIPLQTHKLQIDLPGGTSVERDLTPRKLTIDRGGTLYWDGRRIADTELPALLAATARDDADLHLQTDPETRYERFSSVLTLVKKGGITRLGFIGNEHMRY